MVSFEQADQVATKLHILYFYSPLFQGVSVEPYKNQKGYYVRLKVLKGSLEPKEPKGFLNGVEIRKEIVEL